MDYCHITQNMHSLNSIQACISWMHEIFQSISKHAKFMHLSEDKSVTRNVLSILALHLGMFGICTC